MWAISKVKEIGKAAFRANYWKAVLIAFILGVGGASSLASSSIKATFSTTDETSSSSDLLYNQYGNDSYGDFYSNYYYGNYGNYDSYYDSYSTSNDWSAGMVAAILGIIWIIAAVVIVIAVLVDAFVVNPLVLGRSKFYLENLKKPAEVKELVFAFDHSYKNIVKIMFLRDLFTALWTCLFVIPGIIKAYEYRMIPYLLAENPNMTRQEAFGRSRDLMNGNKWNAFVFDLSFIGWYILSVIPFVGMFWVNPYKKSANAALYDAIRITKNQQRARAQAGFYEQQAPVNDQDMMQQTPVNEQEMHSSVDDTASTQQNVEDINQHMFEDEES